MNPGRCDGPAIPAHPHIGLPQVVPGMGRVFRSDLPVPPASASPPGCVPGVQEPVRVRLPTVCMGGFRCGVPAVRGQQPGVSWDCLHSMAFHRHLCGDPPASPHPRGLPTSGGPPHASEWFCVMQRHLPGLQHSVVHVGHLPI